MPHNIIFLSLSPVVTGAYVIENADLFGSSGRDPVTGEVHCVGTEPGLTECSHSSIGFHHCGRLDSAVPDIAINCHGECV